jgi:NAD+ kinase
VKIGVCSRTDRPDAVAAAHDAAARLRSDGHAVVEIDLESETPADLRDAALVCVFGGDGTVLRAVRRIAPLGIPLLGVNVGRLGFLTGTSVDELDGTVKEVVAGRFETEVRTVLEANVTRNSGGGRSGSNAPIGRVTALNDIVVARGAEVRAIHLDVGIDDERFTVYWADGIIVATATGSTAYSMAAGGPLMLPDNEAIVVVPIAPHLTFGNAVVLPPSGRVSLEVLDEPARLSVDGQEEHDLRVGDRVDVRRSDVRARFVRTKTMRPFLRLLRQKILKEGNGTS